jgi:hypothetical protein
LVLELFISGGAFNARSLIKGHYEVFFSAYLASEKKTPQNEPNYQNFLAYLTASKLPSKDLRSFENSFVLFSVATSTTKVVEDFCRKLNFLVLSFFEELLVFDLFVVESIKAEAYNFERPFIVFREDVLARLKRGTQKRLKAKENENEPCVTAVKDWSGSFPFFGFGGRSSSRSYQNQFLVHLAGHGTQLHSFECEDELLRVLNCLQRQPFVLNPSYKNVWLPRNKSNVLWLADNPESLDLEAASSELLEQGTALKVPTAEQLSEYRAIRNRVTSSYETPSGNIPKALREEWHEVLLQKTSHIFSKEDVTAYNEHKSLKKRFASLESKNTLFNALVDVYSQGIFESPTALFFEYFLD